MIELNGTERGVAVEGSGLAESGGGCWAREEPLANEVTRLKGRRA